MKYLLKNKTTGEEHLCEKVVIDGYDYYVNKNIPKIGDSVNFFNGDNYISKVIDKIGNSDRDIILEHMPESRKNGTLDYREMKKIIATNNPSIVDIPKVVDEVGSANWIAKDLHGYDKNVPLPTNDVEVNSFVEGYNKSQSTHSNTDEDMIEFTEWCNYPIYRADGELGFRKRVQVQYPDYNSYTIIDEKGNSLLPTGKFFTTKGLIEFWKEQKVKTIWYE